MPLTTLDEKTALITIDLQKGILGMLPPEVMKPLLDNAANLAKAFRARNMPVVLVNVAGVAPGRTDAGRLNISSLPPDWAEFAPELERQSGDHAVTKYRIGAFIGTDLDDYLRGRGVTQVVLLGVATSMGVEATARSAHDLGYNVSFVTDAMADRQEDNHRHSIDKIFPRLGESGTTEDLLGLLAAKAA